MGKSRRDELASLKTELLEQLRPHRQEHVLRFWDELGQLQKMTLATQIAQINFATVSEAAGQNGRAEDWHDLVRRASPPPAFRLGVQSALGQSEAIARGQQALRQGEIAAVLVAGGQGTRLGFDQPKGMYRIGPISQASLFQILFEKLIAARRRYGAAIPLVLMTSPATHEDTLEYLDRCDRFGLPEEDLFVITQGTMPAIDLATGRVLMASPGSLALSPDGHGGILAAMLTASAFGKLADRGIRHLFYFQVDNPLVKVCDPEFIGYHLLSRSQASTLAVAKHDPRDKVGNILSVDDRLRIIEYSEFNELDDRWIAARDAEQRLRFWAGNTAIHAFELAFLDQIARSHGGLPFHVATKKVPFLDESGQYIEPDQPNALKFERFIFDLLPLADRAIVVETDEKETFGPVKNAPGEPKDSPETARAQMIALHVRWLKEAGARVATGTPVEISPLFAADAETLRARITPGTVIDRPTYLRE